MCLITNNPHATPKRHTHHRTQVVRELKTTAYRPRSVLLGSREQLCVHPEVSKLKGGLQNRRCGVLTSNHGCRCVITARACVCAS